jgi:hypothetical protein
MEQTVRLLVSSIIARKLAEAPSGARPTVLWCDPDGAWGGIVQAVFVDAEWALDVFEGSELSLSSRLSAPSSQPCVVVVPLAAREFKFIRPLLPRLAGVFDIPVDRFLQQNGVVIPQELNPREPARMLSAAVTVGLDVPLGKLFSGGGALLPDSGTILKVLAQGQSAYDELVAGRGLADSFSRRTVVDFGLPKARAEGIDAWSVEATAALVCTEAACKYPLVQPPDTARVIAEGAPRHAALALFNDWKDSISLSPYLERASRSVDGVLGMSQWAAGVDVPGEPVTSRQAEEVFFTRLIESASAGDDVRDSARLLESLIPALRTHAYSFWGAEERSDRIPWHVALGLAEAAAHVVSSLNACDSWNTSADAVAWYTAEGWKLDHAGERLFVESYEVPPVLSKLQGRIRKLYQRTIDSNGRSFSSLIEAGGVASTGLDWAGAELRKYLNEHPGESAALIFLDGLRFDMGVRLAARMNDHEERGTVWAARAPLPSITPLGMAAALPMAEESMLEIEYSTGKRSWVIHESGRSENLATAAGRRTWLKDVLGAERTYDVSDILDGKVPKAGDGKIIAVFGKDLDAQGHEGQLEIVGAEQVLDRYEALVRKLRDAGFRLTVCTTDHGFIHWEPDETDVMEKPSGSVGYESRRAVTGHGLAHETALVFDVEGSDLQVAVPRSAGAFKAHGSASGYFHGGATLEELVIPVVPFRWPAKSEKLEVRFVDEFTQVTSERPRIKLVAQQGSLFGPDEGILPRSVVIKLSDPRDGRLVFLHSDSIAVEPSTGEAEVVMRLVDERPTLVRESVLEARLIDADSEQLLDSRRVTLMIDIDDW